MVMNEFIDNNMNDYLDDETNELFDDLINYNQHEPEKPVEKITNLTFLQPNIDILPRSDQSLNQYYFYNVHNEKIKKFMLNSVEYAADTNQYNLQIVEQPRQCRTSGSGEKDRRPIDPAPIVKLQITRGKNDIENNIECPFYVLHVSLWSSNMRQQHDLIENRSLKPSRILFGSLVSTPSLLKDLDEEKYYFFSFPDLSIRISGQFRLKFDLIHLASGKVIQEIFSDIFIAYPAKSYPGMQESSEISRHLAKQGLKLNIRSQTRSSKQ